MFKLLLSKNQGGITFGKWLVIIVATPLLDFAKYDMLLENILVGLGTTFPAYFRDSLRVWITLSTEHLLWVYRVWGRYRVRTMFVFPEPTKDPGACPTFRNTEIYNCVSSAYSQESQKCIRKWRRF